MRQAVVRCFFIRAGALLLAAVPVSSVSADEVGIAGATPSLHPGAVARQSIRDDGIVAPFAATGQVDEASPVVREAASLRPGEFVWRPDLGEHGAVEIVVSIPLQRAYVYRGGTLIGVTTVSTGRPGNPTPVGTFGILQKRRVHHSNLYNNAPMPFMQRLTWDGIALHAGQIPGHPASHGCVRLPLDFARNLFAVTAIGGTVHVTDRSPSAREALAMVRGNGAYRGMGGPVEVVPAAAD